MEMFFVSDYLRLHIKNSHKMTSDDYIDKHDQLESKSMTISCMICNHVMKRNLFAINKHVESQHNMDVIRYGKKFRLPKYKVNYLGYPSKEEGAIAADPDGEEAAAPVKRPSLVLGNKPGPKSKKAKISGPKPIPAKVVKHLRWFEGSEYGCRICSDVLFSEEDLKDHLKEKHSSMAKSYLDKQKESLITQERLYKCQVCDEDVNHTMDHITR